MTRRLGVLIGGSVVFWILLAVPAARIWGMEMYGIGALAGALCLVPTLLAMLWAGWAEEQSPQQQLIVVMGGTGLRMMVVLGVGMFLSWGVPWFSEQELLYPFWGWVLVFYLFTLTLEIALLVGGRKPASNP